VDITDINTRIIIHLWVEVNMSFVMVPKIWTLIQAFLGGSLL
jgi:hypothetical protein